MERTTVPNWAQPLPRPATPNQVNYIKVLLDGKVMPDRPDMPDRIASLKSELDEGRLSFDKASKSITWLKALSWKSAAEAAEGSQQSSAFDIPDGYYAVRGQLEGYANEVNFFRLKHGKPEGQWSGFQFITHVVAGGHDHRIRGTESRKKVYQAIQRMGLSEAQMLFASELGRCYKCGRMLTDDTSRALGIGPVCRGD